MTFFFDGSPPHVCTFLDNLFTPVGQAIVTHQGKEKHFIVKVLEVIMKVLEVMVKVLEVMMKVLEVMVQVLMKALEGMIVVRWKRM